MTGVMVTTRKETSFQGRMEEFSNVYFLGDGGGIGSTSLGDAEAILRKMIDREKPIFASAVNFLGGSVRQLGPLGGPVSGPALHVLELAPIETGGMGTSTSEYRECAIMIRWLLGGRRFLRSMLHTCHNHGYNATGITATTPASLSAALKAYADANLAPLHGAYRRISPKTGQVPFAVGYAPYLEHRQFHKGKKHPLFFS